MDLQDRSRERRLHRVALEQQSRFIAAQGREVQLEPSLFDLQIQAFRVQFQLEYVRFGPRARNLAVQAERFLVFELRQIAGLLCEAKFDVVSGLDLSRRVGGPRQFVAQHGHDFPLLDMFAFVHGDRLDDPRLFAGE
jgi:hypothetical protein